MEKDSPPGPRHEIEVREAILEAVALALCEAAAEADLQARVPSLEVLEGPQQAVDLRLGLLPDAAGVEQDEVRLLGPLGEFVPLPGEHAGDLLRVGFVGLTAKGDQRELRHPLPRRLPVPSVEVGAPP